MEATKVVVTNWGALEGKYGAAGLARVRAAIDQLAAADVVRGLRTRVIGLDSPAEMRPFRAPAVRGADDREGAKRAVDAIDRNLLPHYILILGGPDVVPMQLLENFSGVTVHGEDGDLDKTVESDLPYACDMPFSTDPADFQGPTRVVGRLPDVPAARSTAYLLRLLAFAARAEPLPPEDYARWFGLTARAWRKSSVLTLGPIFGDLTPLRESPPATVGLLTREMLAPRLHFVNCHGARNDPGYYGDDGAEEHARQPKVLSRARVKGSITPGTVLVAECCYGAQIYSPLKKDGARMRGQGAIALEYLGHGALGVFGSTTVAYGHPDRNEFADVICRIFIERIRKGASLGRAALEARQRYMRGGGTLNPVKLKTLSQFLLLGDPSIHPIRVRGRAAAPVTRRTADRRQLLAQQRERRRQRQREEGKAIAAASASLREEGVTPEVTRQVIAIAEQHAMRAKVVRLFSLLAGKAAFDRGEDNAQTRAANEQVAMLVEVAKEARRPGEPQIPRYAVLIATLRRGRVVEFTRVVSH